MHLKLSFALFMIGSAQVFAATLNNPLPACVTDTLKNYAINYGTPDGGACTIGNLAYSRFFFSELKVTSSSALTFSILAENLILDPVSATNSFNIAPVNTSLFNRTITIAERYLITYNIDPPPIIAGDELSLDPPVGTVYATKWGCVDSDFSPQSSSTETILQNVGGRAGYTAGTFKCGSSPQTDPYILKTDGDPSTSPTTIASITFPQSAAIVNVRLVLDFEPGTITGFDAIQSPVATTIPEPTTNIMIDAGLIGFGLLSRLRLKR